MSGVRYNDLSIYLRPIEDQQPYQLNNAAKWLVSIGNFKTFYQARRYISYIEYMHPWRFKTLMSNFHAATDLRKNFKVFRSLDDYRTSNVNSYGDEPHMYT